MSKADKTGFQQPSPEMKKSAVRIGMEAARGPVSGMDNRQLRELLDAALGEPPHRVTVAAVRRRLVRRRVAEAVGVSAAVVVVAGLGVAVAVRVLGAGPGPAATSRADVPRYYVQQSFGGAGGPKPAVVRATATGVVTATVGCPWPNAQVAPGGITAAGDQAFFVICQKGTRHGQNFVITGSRVYRVQLTGSGRISGYSPVHGGVLGPHRVDGIAATLDSSQIAVAVGPPIIGAVNVALDDVFVINTQTGARAVWHSGTNVEDAFDLRFAHDGRELVFLTSCGPVRVPPSTYATGCGELRAVSPVAAGGLLDSSRLLVRLSRLTRSPADLISDVVISPDGSALTAAVIHRPNRPHHSTSISVIRYSAATGRQLRVLYKMRTGNGFSYQFLHSDLTGRYLLLNAGPARGTVNGWLDHGRLIRLKPANGSNILYETW